MAEFKPGDVVILNWNYRPEAQRSIELITVKHGLLWVYLGRAPDNFGSPVGRVKAIATGYTTSYFEAYLARPEEQADG